MKVLGLCGGSGSGKGTVCDIFAKLGIGSIDTDNVYHVMTSSKSECLDELVREFGVVILTDGALNRRTLRDIVFTSKEKLDRLNQITHFHILAEVRKTIQEHRASGALAIIVDAPALFESGFDRECDHTICVVADKEIRIARIMERDSISREDAVKRISSQISDDVLRDKCDYVIENNSSVKELENTVERVYKLIFDI